MLNITTPNIEGPNGNSSLNTYTFSGNSGRKFFVIENQGATVDSVYFSISGTGSTGGFRIFPSGLTSTNYNSVDILLNPGELATFSVDYNSAWGTASSVDLISSTIIYTNTNNTNVLVGPTTSITFSTMDDTTLTRREIGSLFCKDELGNYQISQAYTPITEDETSFGIIRTNPKLTGNIKITVDSADTIWLNSIDATKELSDDRFKKYKIGNNSSYTYDVKRFFDSGTTPPEIVFSLYQIDSQYTSTKRTLSEQYDKFYQYGVTSLKNKFYDEDFSFFAPLYLKNEVPEYFVIFRTNGPINKFTYDLPMSEWSSEVISQVIGNSQIVKTYSLGEDTSIGSYIRNIVNHPSRTETDMTVSYQKSGYTTYNGISYTKGSFVQAGELLHDYFNEENPLISVEEFVSLGFERNKVLSSHVINLEFLFNDDQADNYSINRYFGLYVNTIDLAKFAISDGALKNFSASIGQLPLPRIGTDGGKLSTKSFTQTNSDGISIYAELDSINRTVSVDNAFSSVVSNISYDATNIYIELDGNFTSRISGTETFNLYTGSGITASAVSTGIEYADEISTVTLLLSTFDSELPISTFALSISDMRCSWYSAAEHAAFITKIFDNEFIENTPRLFYVKDNKSVLHTVQSTSPNSFYTDTFNTEDVIEIKLKDTKLDMSMLSGFSNIFTQTPCKTLDSKGHGSMQVEILNYFSPNDYIEISYNQPSTSGYPLRWRIVANDTGVNPGESWPSYSITSDADGEYYVSYFHPGNSSINIDVLVKSMESAFNRFPFNNYQVLAKGNILYIKSVQDGTSSNASSLNFYVANSGIKIMNSTVDITGSVLFIGGTDRRNTRGKILTSIATGILSTEYISTQGSFSLPKSYNILNDTITYSPYLEEPIYDDTGEILVDFKGADEYSIVCLNDEKQPIQLTSSKMLTTYSLFEPTFGILSIMPLRDFDTDFFSSEYTKSYLPELIEYFGRYAAPSKITQLDLTLPYLCTFDKGYTFSSYPASVPFLVISENGIDSPILHNSNDQFIFSAAGTTAEWSLGPSGSTSSLSVGDTILLMPNDKHMYFSDLELSKFKGFLALSGVISSDDEETFKSLENQWDPTRFTFQLLNSEYDRLSENYLKTLVTKSRIVPYISKWVSPQGKDIRDNPYRFNYHRSFGNMGFSPSGDMLIPDPRFHTHEWPYLDSVPDNFSIERFPEYAFSYMFDHLSSKYDFSSLKRDWFTEYFTAGYPTEMYMDSNGVFVSAKIDPAERYSYFNYQDYNDTTTSLFRGYKFSIKELNSSGAPIDLSTKYDNYKFSAIIESIEDDQFNFEDPISFKTIVNEKWKFILLKITVRTSSYRYETGNLSYIDLYTLYNDNEQATYVYDPSWPYLSGYSEAIPKDVKLTAPINYGSYSGNPTLITTYMYFDNFFISDTYKDNLMENVIPLNSSVFSNIVATYDAGFYRSSIAMFPPSDVYSHNTIHMNSGAFYNKIAGLSIPIFSLLPSSFIPWNEYTFYHTGGGNSSLDGIRERLSFSEILKVMTATSDKANMTYEIYKADGSTSSESNFIINPISPEELTRIYDYYPVNDDDKPSMFYTLPSVGSILEQQKDLQTLYRYQGNFSPKFKDVLKFWLREDETFTNVVSRDFLLNNTHIGSELDNFSILKNQYYFKVSDAEVLRLSASSGYKPLYPLINEISIDKKDVFAWNSTWDQNYYRKYQSTSDYTNLKGTSEMKEDKSVLGSKAMKLPRSYDLYELIVIPANTSNLSLYTTEEFVYFEDAKFAYLQVNASSKLLRELMGTETDPKAKQEFLTTMNAVPESFDPALIDDYVKLYIQDNILDLFDISEIRLYVLETGNPGNDLVKRPLIEVNTDTTLGLNFTLTESELKAKKYILKKDAKITNIGNLSFQIKYPLDSRYYTSLSIGISIKRI